MYLCGIWNLVARDLIVIGGLLHLFKFETPVFKFEDEDAGSSNAMEDEELVIITEVVTDGGGGGGDGASIWVRASPAGVTDRGTSWCT